jgi:hypothetical protein
MQQRAQLRGDAENGTGDDANNGVKQSAKDGSTHEKHVAFWGRRVGGSSVAALSEQPTAADQD